MSAEAAVVWARILPVEDLKAMTWVGTEALASQS
jgi:hypothetical protein